MKKNEVTPIDDEEKSLITAYREIDVKKLKKPTKAKQTYYKTIAKDWVRKEAKMNIRISPTELTTIKKIAFSEGIKYQAFVRNILHKYVTGQLGEKKVVAR